jgi:hypothetical protein
MDDERLDKIRHLETKREREWDHLLIQRQQVNELAFEVGDRRNEFLSASEEITAAFEQFKQSDEPGVHEAYLAGKREVDAFVDRFNYELRQKQREYEDRYDEMGREMQKILDSYDGEIDVLRRG